MEGVSFNFKLIKTPTTFNFDVYEKKNNYLLHSLIGLGYQLSIRKVLVDIAHKIILYEHMNSPKHMLAGILKILKMNFPPVGKDKQVT